MDSVDNNGSLVNKITNELNERQREAVTSSSNGILQIIAGPGTGKTKVLISRVAYLLLNCQIPPQNIIVTTFTKKAANELVERLKLILDESTINLSKLMVGTFHSICFRILKIYGGLIGKEGYSIASEKDSMQILQEVLLNLNREEIDVLDNMPEDAKTLLSMNAGQDHKYHGFDPKKFKRQISKLKSNGILPESYTKNKKHNSGISLVYNKYQEKLAIDKLFDFDDCLLYTHLLISSHPVLNFIQHVLVDEFQDTNEIQLRLMYEFSRGHPTDPKWQNNLTIVGDPDQSIYAFRDAQSINFEKMKLYYEKRDLICNQITLQENYRSTIDILQFSEDIMRQQSNRILKSLRSQKNASSYPVYKNLLSSEEEARWIAYQIQFLLALPNALVRYKDISILVRSAYQTRVIENELVKNRIPYLMIRGKAFWERKEVMAIMDYMRIVANGNDRIAYLRTLNYPKRGIGEKTFSYIDSIIDNWVSSKRGLIFEVLRYISTSTKNDAKLSLKSKLNLKSYLDFIIEARNLLYGPELNLETLFDLIYTKSGIKHEIREDDDAILNIQEVQRQLEEFEPRDDEIPPFIGSSQKFERAESNILLEFVSSVGLYETDNEKASNGENTNDCKVSLSTIHGSKGLEWPVVFIPGLSDGILPAGFAMSMNTSEEIDEERRCFYVAATRAKALLYISSYTEIGAIGKWGRKPINEVSRFITEYEKRKKLQPTQISFSNWEKLEGLYENMGKILPQKPKFDLRRFYQYYEKQLDIHLEGHFYDISKEDFSVLTEITNGVKRLYSGFSTAKLGIDTKKLKTSQNNPSLNSSKLPKPLKGDIRSFFKPPRQEKNEVIEVIKATNKAPAYTPIRTNCPKRSFAPHSNNHLVNDSLKLQPSKAPPYVPVRKVPPSFRRGNHLTKNSLPP